MSSLVNGDEASAVHLSSSHLSSSHNGAIHLRRGGTSLVLDVTRPDGPVLVHWGADLGECNPETLHSLSEAERPQRTSGGLDRTGALGAFATPATGWLGTPAIEGHRDGHSFAAHLSLTGISVTSTQITCFARDEQLGLEAEIELALDRAGLFRQNLTLRNAGETSYTVDALRLFFPVPWDATEILDTTGRHLRERSHQRHEFVFGTHQRESRRGRPGADATVLMAAGQKGFGFEDGTVFGVHLAWSGNHRMIAERTPTGYAFLGAEELYLPGELVLQPGESVTTPAAFGSWGEGLNQLSARFHTSWRDRAGHPRRPRPITLNTWEAVYFNHDLDTLTALADAAAEVGVERFVLDDGWFLYRRDDTAGLGDWFVDPQVWPRGLGPIVEHVTGLGMEFGLWVEPEMINPDSDLARNHPEWILRGRAELPPPARQQQVLNIAHPEAYAYIAQRLHSLLEEYPIAYLKWDHNRDLIDAGSGPGGRAGVRAQTLALYRLLGELKETHPGLEIESCASGGSRVDLGILQRTDRVWTSDCLDPIERLEIQRYTGLVVPPEMMGMHFTTPAVHSTGRIVDTRLSGAVALFGHVGIEWDLTTLSSEERAHLKEWIELATTVRPLVASGQMLHVDTRDPGLDVRGVVAKDQRAAYFTIAQSQTLIASPTGRVRLPGLDPETSYAVELVTPGGIEDAPAQSPQSWAHRTTVMTGRQLGTAGLRPPVQNPQRAVVVAVTATGN